MKAIDVSLSSGTTIKDAKLALELIQKSIPVIERRISSMESKSNNPQVALILAKEKSALDTLLAVEAALYGNKVALRLLSE